MKISQNGVDLIKSFEGFSSIAYKDVAGLSTIGYGTLIDEDSEKYLLTTRISKYEAEELLIKDIEKMEVRLAQLLKSTLTQNQYDSICSFAYNCGVGNLRKSKLLVKVNTQPNDPAITNEFLKWIYAGGKIVEGLKNRREKEYQLYFTYS